MIRQTLNYLLDTDTCIYLLIYKDFPRQMNSNLQGFYLESILGMYGRLRHNSIDIYCQARRQNINAVK